MKGVTDKENSGVDQKLAYIFKIISQRNVSYFPQIHNAKNF